MTEQLFENANQRLQAGQLAEAAALYRQILQADPNHPRACNNLGITLRAQGELDKAIDAFRQAAKLAPRSFEFQNNLGTALMNKGDMPEAIVQLRQALKIRPDNPGALYNLAMALEGCGEFPESQTCYERSIQLQPDAFSPRVNYAALLLKMGNADLAWTTFFEAGQFRDALATIYPEKRWDGREAAGQTILVHNADQFGDSLLLARFVPLLKKRGVKIVLQCRPQLTSLFESLGADATIPLDQPPPKFDWYTPLWTLPSRLGFTFSTIPSAVPYLAAPEDRLREWSGRVPADGKKNIGLVWAGSESGLRSRSLDIFAPLAAVPGVRFFSLQVGAESSQKPLAGAEWVDYTQQLRDFSQTAALVAQLDLVISVDTSTAHLAGALGKPVWTLVPKQANFFWLPERDKSSWYPTMRLFRQTAAGDWQTPVARMAEQLKQWVRS